ncbi:MAG: polysaccharide biosynthesis tyrosine autokinase [Bryobacteraceae bacterium]|jgi:capsular exopolysaccharide synthesis family protein
MNQLPPPGDPAPNELEPRFAPAGPPPARPGYFEPPDQDFDQAASGGLLEYWRMLRRRKGTLVLIAFLGALAGFLLTLPQTPVYQARLSLEIQSVNENFLNMRDVNPTESGSSSYYPEYDIQTQVRIIQSRSLIERVIKKLDLENRPLIINDSRLSAWRKALGLPAPKPVSLRDNAIAMAAGNLKVRAQANTRLIEVLCDSTSPNLAADFANTLANEFIDQNLEARWQTSQRTGEWLTRQMEGLKIKLEKSEEALQSYARATGLLFTSEKDNLTEQKLRQLQEELTKAQADRVAKQSKLEMAASTSPDSLPDVLDDGSLKDVQAKLIDLQRQLAELSSTYTPAHFKVRKVRAQISAIESALEKERRNIVRRIRNDYQTAARREKLLAADYATHARLFSGQAALVSHYNILKREVDTNRQLYDNMLQRVKEAGIASALRASNIRVVDPAQVPGAPYKPSPFMNSALGLLSGIFLGVVFIVMRERADRSIREPGESQFFLDLSELGIIPSADSDPTRKRRLLPSHNPDSASLNQLAVVTRDRKPSAMAEAFRTVLTSILFCSRNGGRPHVLVLASANPREGKTTIVSNLAIALTEIHQRVLLIDGDMRRPRIHEIFDLENKPGLGDLLRQPATLDGCPIAGVHETSIPNLFVLPAGSSGAAVSSLVYSDRLPELMARVRQDFDMVLIDSPPLLQMADARVMGRYADAVILVVRANQTTRDAVRMARQRLADDGTHVLGTILNDWNPRHTASYGYYKYYDHYHHYYGSKDKS